MNKAIPLVLLAVSLFLGSVPASAATAFQFLGAPGRYPVGLKVVDQYDHSRTFPGSFDGTAERSQHEGSRPVQTLIWYPSLPSTAAAMTAGDYAQLANYVIDFNHPTRTNRWHKLLKRSLGVKLWARRGATPAEGKFPIVVYAPSDSSVSWENADLCEYLASHGYVVLASPSMGASTRDMTDDLAGINAQARDISFLVSYGKTLPDADPAEVAVIGWSWGGISNLFAAWRDRRIDAVVALDGSMRYYPGLVQKAGIAPGRMTVPLLFFTEGNFSLEDLDKIRIPASEKFGPSVLNEWTHGDLLTVHMLGMAHPEFSSMFQRRETAKRFKENQVADYDRQDANISYAWVARYTLNFLDAYLKHNEVAEAFLKRAPAANGVPRHFMAVSVRPAISVPAANPRARP